MKVLVACEESQAVTIELRKKFHFLHFFIALCFRKWYIIKEGRRDLLKLINKVDKMEQVRELCSGEIYNAEDVTIIYVNKDQLAYDNSNYNKEDVIGIPEIWDTLEEHEKEWHNQSRHTPFIVGDECLYECEEVENED